MKIESPLSEAKISTRLLAVNMLICVFFFLIVFIVFISFHQIKGPLTDVIDDMNDVSINALAERELSSIITDINLLLTTFFENGKHLNAEGMRLLTVSRDLAERTRGRDLEQPLYLFEQKLALMLQQCERVSFFLSRLNTMDHNMKAGINRLEDIISDRLIEQVLKGEDAAVLKQLLAVVTEYRLKLLEIGKQHAEKWPSKYYTPLDTINDPLIAVVNELNIRFTILKATEDQIAETGETLSRELLSYRSELLNLNKAMVELKSCKQAVDDAKEQTAAVMETLDRNISQASRAANTTIAHIFRMTQITLLVISAALGVGLMLFTGHFFRESIKKPMETIRRGIKSFRSGNLDARIRLNRRDEWSHIEAALNTMAEGLSVSAAALQKANDTLEAKVKERTLELFEAKEQALEAKRVAEAADRAKSIFMANMSHELRTPLNAVLGFSEILYDKEEEAGKKSYLKSIRHAGKLLLGLINDILDLSKLEAGKMELSPAAVSIKDLCYEIQSIFRHKTGEKGIEFQVRVDKTLPSALLLDGIRMRQVLMNLLGNAIKFTDEGFIRLTCERGEPAPDSPDAVNLVIKVADSGRGIAKEDQHRIFDAFEQAAGQQVFSLEGTGLGLSITRNIVRLMKGNITLESAPGAGAVFSVVLPDVKITADKTGDGGSDAMCFPGLNRSAPATILIADDIVYNRNVMAAYLDLPNITCCFAGDGEMALKKASDLHPDLILMDMRMPRMDGFEAAEQLKSNPSTRDIPIIAVTASLLGQDEEQIWQHCDGYLHKPVSRDSLLCEVRKFLADAEAEQPASTTDALPGLPAAADLKKLYEIAGDGDMDEVAAYLDYLEQQERNVNKFCDEIRTLALGYKYEKIILRLETSMKTASEDTDGKT